MVFPSICLIEVSSGSKVIGNHAIPRGRRDSDKYATIELTEAMTVPMDGVIESWKVFSDKDTAIVMQVWRPDASKSNSFKLVGQNYVSLKANRANLIKVPLFEQINVKKGDMLGWWYPPGTTVGLQYDSCSDSVTKILQKRLDSGADLKIDESIDMSVTTWYRCRRYSVGAIVKPGKLLAGFRRKWLLHGMLNGFKA